MHTRRIKVILTIIAICFCLTSCASLSGDVRVFFVGEGKMQYFFPATVWRGSQDGYRLEADWLYRNYPVEQEQGPARTVFNFSILHESRALRETPAFIQIEGNGNSLIIEAEQISVLYVDQGITRFSSWCYSEELQSVFSGSDETLAITVAYEPELQFFSGRDFLEHLTYFRDVIAE